MKEFLVVIANIAVYFTALVTTVLVIVYGVYTQWETTQVGRQFMLTKASLAVVLDLTAVIISFSPRSWTWTPFTPLRAVVYVGIGIVMLRWLIILFRAQRQARRNS